MAAAWSSWRDRRDSSARERLVRHHLDFARMIAAMVYARRTHNDVPFEDYLQLARVGLLEAVDRFDPAHGVRFRTFASRRVQGAVLNGLVKATEKNQQISVRMRLRQERLACAKDAHRRPGGTPEQLFGRLADIGIGLALGVLLEDSGMLLQGDADRVQQAPSPEVSYFRRSEMRQLRERLLSLTDQLSDPQRMVVRRHYLQEISFEDIALSMGVSRGRISQLHRQALGTLKTLFGDSARCDFSV